MIALTVYATPALWGCQPLYAQQFSYRGFADVGVVAHPQEAPNDSTQAIEDAQVRFEPALRLGRSLTLAASIEGRIDTHDRTAWWPDGAFWERTTRRPQIGVRSFTAAFAHGPLTLEVGKQFVRWGQSDILSPTDYFTPRDYLVSVSSEVLAPTAARLTLAASDTTMEVVYVPRMTPTRMPLLDQRWIGLQATEPGLPLRDAGAVYPEGPQYGVRIRRSGQVEYSASFFEGFHHLPRLLATPAASPAGPVIDVERHYPAIRAWGGDAVVPVGGTAIKAEAAWLKSRDKDVDDYGLWVLQAERQHAEWLFIGGYVGEWVTATRDALRFAPDRGHAKSVIGRASRTFPSDRSLLVEAVVRTNGNGLYAKTEYSQSAGAHWRVTIQALIIRGNTDDFLGQYRRNSLSGARARYSF